MQYYDSATIVVPTQEDVQKWQNWIQLYITTYEHEQLEKYKPERIVPRG